MKILVLGATGRTGKHVIGQALDRRYSVTAVSRSQTRSEIDSRASIVIANPLSAPDLVGPLSGQDIVISCLGQTSKSAPHLLSDSARATLSAMQSTGIRRYIAVSQGLLFPSRNPVVHLLRLVLARITTDSSDMELIVKASDVKWTIVRPPRLREGREPRGYRASTNARPTGSASMSRCDLATFLLDEAEKPQFERAIVGVTSA